MQSFNIAVIAGTRIGKEVFQKASRVLESRGAPL